MTDYEQWLAKVREALAGRNHSAVARWLAARMGLVESAARLKLHRMLAGQQEPLASFVCTLNVWLAEGCPVMDSRKGYTGSAGGKARAEQLPPERRREIAVQARAAHKGTKAQSV